MKEQIKVLCLSEIWHPDVANIKFLHKWAWYKSVRTEQEGGGAAIIVRPDVKSVERPDITADVEMSWCELYVQNTSILGQVQVKQGQIRHYGGPVFRALFEGKELLLEIVFCWR